MSMANQNAPLLTEEIAGLQRELAHAKYQHQQVKDSINQLKRHGAPIPQKLEKQHSLLSKEIMTLEGKLKA